jgi:hypothetical protein
VPKFGRMAAGIVNRLYFGDNLEWLRDRREFPKGQLYKKNLRDFLRRLAQSYF